MSSRARPPIPPANAAARPHGAPVLRVEADLPGASASSLTRLLAAEIAAAFGESVLVVRRPRADERPDLACSRALDGTHHAVATPDVWTRFTDFDRVLADDDGSDLPPGITTLRVTRGAGAGASDLLGVPADAISPDNDLGACRFALSAEALSPRSIDRARLGLRDRANLARWARAATGRLVGVALSGGGAWGFLHVVLLRELTRRGVPIDVVSGASIGATVGAYFAARGLDGLDRLVERADRGDLGLAAIVAIVSTRSIERLVRSDLGDLRLDDLAVRFCPIATDLTKGESVAFVRGSLARAVRASASAPGLWAPTIHGAARYVDGAVSNHLPAKLLRRMGASLTLASNGYPYDRGEGAPAPSAVARFFSAVSPVARLRDLARSGNLLLHRSGDHGGSHADVLFDVEPQDSPITGAFRFTRARAVIAWAERHEELHRRADDLAAAWSRLAQRPSPLSLSQRIEPVSPVPPRVASLSTSRPRAERSPS